MIEKKSKIKVVFLDIDGILNHSVFYHNRPTDDKRPYPLSDIDPIAVGYLNQICLQSGAKVVVISTWRHGRTVQELQNILAECGFVGEVIDVTPSLRHEGDYILRGNEVLKWMKDNEELIRCSISVYGNNFEEYIILDDDVDFLLQQKDNFIHVDRHVGITPQTVSIALKILNRYDPEPQEKKG